MLAPPGPSPTRCRRAQGCRRLIPERLERAAEAGTWVALGASASRTHLPSGTLRRSPSPARDRDTMCVASYERHPGGGRGYLPPSGITVLPIGVGWKDVFMMTSTSSAFCLLAAQSSLFAATCRAGATQPL